MQDQRESPKVEAGKQAGADSLRSQKMRRLQRLVATTAYPPREVIQQLSQLLADHWIQDSTGWDP